MSGLSLIARPKVNLFLHVTGRRDDGYHLLESLVIFPEGGDELFVEAAAEISLTVTGEFAGNTGPDEENLVLRTAKKLQEMAGVTAGAAIRLRKNLPVAAGLGGGSADAAATFHLLQELWECNFPDEDIFTAGLALGADVPACLLGRPAIMSGIGEVLTPVPGFPALHVLLVNSGAKVPTGAVFSKLAHPFEPLKRPAFEEGIQAGRLISLLKQCRNDLETPACEVAPEINEVLRLLSDTEGCRLSRMSGSGATCFGLYASEEEAVVASQVIRARHPDWWVSPTIA
ncbi:MAG: 4-(cytidine 5'-diphospho)-2-C-methyl-D-erythritol kinase [Alphaproteobacteria bacterium]|nr:MAG: 4-(cytidine 5'-diphospho)-2-C-methyl-D-erythritol kinase [Alphaproteobacteria bacterium]